MKIADTNVAVMVLAILLSASCASAPQYRDDGMNDSLAIDPAFDTAFQAQRKVAGGAKFSWLLARSAYENPVTRPISNASTLVSYVLKSTGGALRRVAIGTLQMPALPDDIPEIVFSEPMDLLAFEKKF